jgi:hypothetical protein
MCPWEFQIVPSTALCPELLGTPITRWQFWHLKTLPCPIGCCRLALACALVHAAGPTAIHTVLQPDFSMLLASVLHSWCNRLAAEQDGGWEGTAAGAAGTVTGQGSPAAAGPSVAAGITAAALSEAMSTLEGLFHGPHPLELAPALLTSLVELLGATEDVALRLTCVSILHLIASGSDPALVGAEVLQRPSAVGALLRDLPTAREAVLAADLTQDASSAARAVEAATSILSILEGCARAAAQAPPTDAEEEAPEAPQTKLEEQDLMAMWEVVLTKHNVDELLLPFCQASNDAAQSPDSGVMKLEEQRKQVLQALQRGLEVTLRADDQHVRQGERLRQASVQ